MKKVTHILVKDGTEEILPVQVTEDREFTDPASGNTISVHVTTSD